MALLSPTTSETEKNNNGSGSYRRRPRKAARPHASPFNSIQDLYRFPPKNTAQKLEKSNPSDGIEHLGSARNLSFFDHLDHCRGKRTDLSSKRVPKRVVPDSEVDEGHRAEGAKFACLNHVGSATIKSCKERVISGVPERRAPRPQTANINGGRNANFHPLPEKFRGKMRELGFAGEPFLVIQKALYASDVDPGKQRLSIPAKQVKDENFLTEQEMALLNDRDQNATMESILIDDELKEWEISFKKWFMSQIGMYVLISPWNAVVKANNLREGMQIQVRSFKMNGKLYFLLVKL